MKVIRITQPYPTVMARDVPQGQVYTWVLAPTST